MRILVTGGTGYIGSHTCVELAQRGHEVCIVDNLSNSSERVLDHLQHLMGFRPEFHRMDVRAPELADLLIGKRIDAVLHFAALKAVGESVREPLLYFNNNVTGTLALLRAMRTAKVCNLVFSSSATVYGDANRSPIDESAPLKAINPYGRTKLMMEEMIGDLSAAWPDFNAALLRYFNPVGAHPSGYLGEDPRGVPNNLMPYIAQVAVGRREALQVFGDDYPTDDGTGVRDYLHVMDLARCTCGRHRLPAAPAQGLGGQSGHRAWLQRARGGGRVRARQWQAHSAEHRAASRWRCGGVLRQHRAGQPAAGLDRGIRPGPHVSRHLALAVDVSGWLCRFALAAPAHRGGRARARRCARAAGTSAPAIARPGHAPSQRAGKHARGRHWLFPRVMRNDPFLSYEGIP
ncbi:UDP-glucose-4-epimerase GalE [Xanthomonas citri pv. citri]|nr:UDP-glucose-4-epimerase GalE [Xanthomonas citri pv. citri]AJZ51111.1 UDP-glucose-4-epimerase GalE [Xanthomonas citri pv. citri]AJZ55732.1 UDP-glucose-4-epimerase GalE [Xanthomonas citri pv. citri]AJZ68522.1 UDP-glucose-4-epimerase GalE [Xanthomonas citri pv. citri]CEE56157.1 putative UDP-glucose 4-epimerase [Xanthomonas citri pv. citri]